MSNGGLPWSVCSAAAGAAVIAHANTAPAMARRSEFTGRCSFVGLVVRGVRAAGQRRLAPPLCPELARMATVETPVLPRCSSSQGGQQCLVGDAGIGGRANEQGRCRRHAGADAAAEVRADAQLDGLAAPVGLEAGDVDAEA